MKSDHWERERKVKRNIVWKKRCLAKSGHFHTHFNKVKLFEMMILIMLMIQYFIQDHQYGPSQCFVKVSICMDIFRKWPQYSENWPNNGVVRLMWAPRHKSEFYVLEIPSSSSINDIGSFCQRKGKYWLIVEICFNFGKPWNDCFHWDHDIAISTGRSFFQRGDRRPISPCTRRARKNWGPSASVQVVIHLQTDRKATPNDLSDLWSMNKCR